MSTPLAGTPAPQIPYGYVGTWAPPSTYGTLISSEIILTAEDWTTLAPPKADQPASWDWATTLGQTIGGVWFPWGTDIQPEGSPYCAPLYAPGYNAPTVGPSTSVGNWRESAPSTSEVVKTCVPASSPVPTAAQNLSSALALLEKVATQIG